MQAKHHAYVPLLLYLMLLICILILMFIVSRKETFNTQTVLTTNGLNYPGSEFQTISNSLMDAMVQGRIDPMSLNLPSRLMIDLPTSLKRGWVPLSFGPGGYVIILSDPRKDIDCAYGFQGKRIGYLSRTDENIIRAIAAAHRIAHDSYEIHLIPDEKWLSLLFEARVEYDLIITFGIAGSQLVKMIARQPLMVHSIEMDMERLKLFYPGCSMEEVTVEKMFGWNTSLQSKEKVAKLIRLQEVIVDLSQPTQVKPEPFITRLLVDEENKDPRFDCYGDPAAMSKEACNSKYDLFGEPRVQQAIWDKKCQIDSDCPFYRANKNYQNTRGGCLSSGLCELPIGVYRTSYRTYDTSPPYQPFCYQCDPPDEDCCKKQLQPDYAFVNDANDRLKEGLPIHISL